MDPINPPDLTFPFKSSHLSRHSYRICVPIRRLRPEPVVKSGLRDLRSVRWQFIRRHSFRLIYISIHRRPDGPVAVGPRLFLFADTVFIAPDVTRHYPVLFMSHSSPRVGDTLLRQGGLRNVPAPANKILQHFSLPGYSPRVTGWLFMLTEVDIMFYPAGIPLICVADGGAVSWLTVGGESQLAKVYDVC